MIFKTKFQEFRNMPKKTNLQNDLRVITKNLPDSKSLTALILVGAGSRYETKASNGLSHFIEHIFFKGGQRYSSAKSVAEAVDSVGGEFNAFTGKQYAGYFIKVDFHNLSLALDILSDMLINSTFDAADIDRERGVILEEYKMYQDTPSYQIGWDLERLLYGNQPMSWDQLGSPDFISSVARDDILNYHKSLYTPDNTVISIVGNVDHEEAVSLCGKFFSFKNLKKAFNFAPLENITEDKKLILRKRYTKQGHVAIGFPAYGESDSRTWTMKVLAMALGGNMSSRMFLKIREEKSLAYSIKTNTDDYTDTGIISTTASVNTDKIEDAISAILEVYCELKDNGIAEKELNKAKSCLKGKILLTLEDSEEFAHLLGKFELLYNKFLTPEEIIANIDRVTIADINNMTKDLFQNEKIKASIIGPFEESEEHKLEQFLKF